MKATITWSWTFAEVSATGVSINSLASLNIIQNYLPTVGFKSSVTVSAQSLANNNDFPA